MSRTRRLFCTSFAAAACAAVLLSGEMLALPRQAQAYGVGTPVASDSRIKTFVFNENDVYRLLTHYGYQMNIEFGNKEEIETISVGDRTGWQIIPGGSRLFVRAMEDKAHTNMTVVTNRHAYQFDLYSSPPGSQGWDELVYVVRFYYPEDQEMQAAGMMGGGMGMMQPPMTPVAAPYAAPYGGMQSAPMQSMGSMAYPPQQPAAPMMAPPMQQQQPPYGAMPVSAQMVSAPPQNQNYNYSSTGEQSILPTQMYDDGQNTYLVFTPGQMAPQLFAVTPDGRERPVAVNANGQYATAQGVYPRLVLRFGSSHACVHNEAMAR